MMEVSDEFLFVAPVKKAGLLVQIGILKQDRRWNFSSSGFFVSKLPCRCLRTRSPANCDEANIRFNDASPINTKEPNPYHRSPANPPASMTKKNRPSQMPPSNPSMPA